MPRQDVHGSNDTFETFRHETDKEEMVARSVLSQKVLMTVETETEVFQPRVGLHRYPESGSAGTCSFKQTRDKPW